MAYCCRELKGGIRDVGFIPKDMQKRCLKVLNMHTNNSARYARIQVTGLASCFHFKWFSKGV
jgi:hypothetical protein